MGRHHDEVCFAVVRELDNLWRRIPEAGHPLDGDPRELDDQRRLKTRFEIALHLLRFPDGRDYAEERDSRAKSLRNGMDECRRLESLRRKIEREKNVFYRSHEV